jgi:hypothetical protein
MFLYQSMEHKSRHELLNHTNIHSDCFSHIAKHGNDEHRDRMLDMPHLKDNEPVNQSIAIFGNNEHRDEILKRPIGKRTKVACAIIRKGNKRHKDILLHHGDPLVRETVARNGNLSHAGKLKNDENSLVRSAARSREYELSLVRNQPP